MGRGAYDTTNVPLPAGSQTILRLDCPLHGDSGPSPGFDRLWDSLCLQGWCDSTSPTLSFGTGSDKTSLQLWPLSSGLALPCLWHHPQTYEGWPHTHSRPADLPPPMATCSLRLDRNAAYVWIILEKSALGWAMGGTYSFSLLYILISWLSNPTLRCRRE